MSKSTFAALAILATAQARLFVSDEAQQKYMWEQFKTEFGKNYETMEEEMSRFSHFISNLKIADKRNMNEILAGGSAIHGITKFSDMSQEEFSLRFLRADMKLKTVDAPIADIKTPPKADMGLVDWTGRLTTPVKNQGYCGSCWAFSATSQIESDAIRTLGASYILSPEQITQCDKGSFGCNGGWTETAYTYVQRAGGIVQESDYPYTSFNGATGNCAVNLNQAVITVQGFSKINGEASMASFVQSTGPLSVCVDANSWNSYTGGIMYSCGQQVDHCVQAVGVDTAGYWKVRNSWGTGWGEGGYIRLAYGQNTCAIASDPTYATVGRR